MKNKIIPIVFALIVISFGVNAAPINETQLYAWNGTAWQAIRTSGDGTLQISPNITNSEGIVPKINNSLSIGSIEKQWSGVFTSDVRCAEDFVLIAGGSEKVTVNASGNVGIGNTNPQQKLAVNGQLNATGTLTSNGTTTIRGIVYNWPSADGAADQILTTNGTGGLNWSTFSGGGGGNVSAVNVSAGRFGADVGGGSFSFPSNISVSQNISASGRVTDKTGFVTPVGGLLPYSGALAPSGWLMANGSEVNRTTYPDLFDVLSTTFGNTSDSTFKLPDLRQRIPLGKADSGTGSTLGGTGGAIDHTHTGPSHTHTYSTVISHTHSMDPASTSSDSTGSHSHTFDPASTASGGGSSHTHSVDPALASTASDGAHTHTVTYDKAFTGCCGGGGRGPDPAQADTMTSGSAGDHDHTFDVASFTSAAETAHTHSTDIGSTASSSNGGHTHSTDVASFTSGSTGSASGTMDAGGTAATGTGNPPFLAVNYIIKY